jgi:hypothetical protein
MATHPENPYYEDSIKRDAAIKWIVDAWKSGDEYTRHLIREFKKWQNVPMIADMRITDLPAAYMLMNDILEHVARKHRNPLL